MSKKLFVGNLPWSITSADLMSILGENGVPFAAAEVLVDRETYRSRGFGFVHFDTDADCLLGKDVLGHITVQGRELRVDEAVSERPGESRGSGRQRREGPPVRPSRNKGSSKGRGRRDDDRGSW